MTGSPPSSAGAEVTPYTEPGLPPGHKKPLNPLGARGPLLLSREKFLAVFDAADRVPGSLSAARERPVSEQGGDDDDRDDHC